MNVYKRENIEVDRRYVIHNREAAIAEANGSLDGDGKFVIDYRNGKTVVVKQPARKPRKKMKTTVS